MRSWLSIPVITLLAGLVAGCQPQANVDVSSIRMGEQSYASKRYPDAIRHLTNYLAKDGNDPLASRALYVRGMANAMSGRRADAYTDLEQAARQSTDPGITWRANASLGSLHLEDEQWSRAATTLSNALARMPEVPPMDALLYRQGLAFERLNRWPQAQAAYGRIVAQFPGGRYAELAGRRLTLGANHFAVQAGVFSTESNARQLVSKLTSGNLPAYIRRETRNGRAYNIVLVGRYDSYAEARGMLARVRGYVPDAQIWP